MDNLKTIRPRRDRGNHLFEPVEYGRSVLGNRLEYWPSGCGNTDLLIIGGIHGEELDSTIVLSKALRMLSSPPERVAVVANANPDGGLRGMRGNAHGVDLNRNFPTGDWTPRAQTHRWTIDSESDVELSTGRYAGSEPETEALISLVNSLQPKRLIALHGPLACIDDPGNSDLGNWLSRKTGLPLVADVGYSTPGSFGTWALEKGIPIITWELPRESIESMFHSTVPVLFEIFFYESR